MRLHYGHPDLLDKVRMPTQPCPYPYTRTRTRTHTLNPDLLGKVHFLPTSPYISLHLPTSPYISLHLRAQLGQLVLRRFGQRRRGRRAAA